MDGLEMISVKKLFDFSDYVTQVTSQVEITKLFHLLPNVFSIGDV